jgi:hypothetical protein
MVRQFRRGFLTLLLLAVLPGLAAHVQARHAESRPAEGGDARVHVLTDGIACQHDVTFTAKTMAVRPVDGDQQFTCTGAPKFSDAAGVITAETMVVYMKGKRAEFTGSVRMQAKPPKETPAPIFTAGRLEYDYQAKQARFLDGVEVTCQEKTARADIVTYDGRTGQWQIVEAPAAADTAAAPEPAAAP